MAYRYENEDEKVTNKDLHNVLTNIKDNHLNHIEKNTEETNRILSNGLSVISKLFWIGVSVAVAAIAADLYHTIYM